ncbi:MAG: leucine--tRNA ligase [Eubacteriales bacterium]|nr:leucine--tRNA ligase [Eubacteriales bacterium]
MAQEIYDPASVEKKWQDRWEDSGVFHAKSDFSLPKYYCLIEFPYPSGNGLHVGHPRSNTAMDIIARKRRMEGYNVLFPIGWDAFGLPTENFAIKNNIHPAIVTKKNVDHFREQLKMLGFSFDYTREVNTTDPEHFKWTQWIFLKLFERGLAYKTEMPINFCTQCKVGLANEEVVDNHCERCGGEVIQLVKSQWMLKITDYAQKLLDGLDDVDFIERVKTQQRNWIGRSEGAEADFQLSAAPEKLKVFTTRPDTLFGATYMVVSPEHPYIEKYADRISNIEEVRAYRKQAQGKSEFERTELNKDKTGVRLEGFDAVNPVTGKNIPIFVSDYVLMSYGTGAIMAVPAHDTRDWEFATKFGLPIIEVVAGGEDVQAAAYTDSANGVLVNSDFLNGLKVPEAKKKITQYLEELGIGKKTVNYKLRDWVFSRQRYWGEPIPLVHCPKCGWVPLPEEQLPLKLPETENFKPGENGESPLAGLTEWINTTCPHCGGPAQRETDTMPQWAGSSWYFLRYMDPHNHEALGSPEALAYWGPVDWYNGGMEHTTLHLLYSRFWHHFLYDIGVVPYAEPYAKRTSHGMILGENGEKMSKSRGNVVNPDDMVNEYGADAFRTYEMFMGAFDQAIPWSTRGVVGCRRFLDRVWKLQSMVQGEHEAALRVPLNKMVKKVGEDFEAMKFNTAIAAMMAFVNDAYAVGHLGKEDFKVLLQVLNPVAPHICEELWAALGEKTMVCQSKWPVYDEAYCTEQTREIAVQVNGKVRGRIEIAMDTPEEEMKALALSDEKVQAFLDGKQVVKVIVVQGKIVNIVVK